MCVRVCALCVYICVCASNEVCEEHREKMQDFSVIIVTRFRVCVYVCLFPFLYRSFLVSLGWIGRQESLRSGNTLKKKKSGP